MKLNAHQKKYIRKKINTDGVDAIARKLKVNTSTVWKYLDRAGISIDDRSAGMQQGLGQVNIPIINRIIGVFGYTMDLTDAFIVYDMKVLWMLFLLSLVLIDSFFINANNIIVFAGFIVLWVVSFKADDRGAIVLFAFSLLLLACLPFLVIAGYEPLANKFAVWIITLLIANLIQKFLMV